MLSYPHMKVGRLLRLMNILLERETNIPKGKVKMYCVGISKKEILIGENKYIVSKQVKYNYPHFSALHAELDFFHKAKKEHFYPSDIFVFGYRKSLLKNTKPCLYCASILNELDFKRIHFFKEGKIITLTKEEFKRALEEEVFKDYT